MVSLRNESVQPIVIDNYRKNWSVAGSWNAGIEEAKKNGHKHCIIANDDTILEQGTLTVLTDALDKNTIFAFPQDRGSAFAFFAVNINLMQKLGGFDESFAPAYFEDNDAYYRSKLAGYTSKFLDNVLVHHEVSQTQNHDPNNPVVPSHQFLFLQEYYIQKWGGLPGSETYLTPFNV